MRLIRLMCRSHIWRLISALSFHTRDFAVDRVRKFHMRNLWKSSFITFWWFFLFGIFKLLIRRSEIHIAKYHERKFNLEFALNYFDKIELMCWMVQSPTDTLNHLTIHELKIFLILHILNQHPISIFAIVEIIFMCSGRNSRNSLWKFQFTSERES